MKFDPQKSFGYPVLRPGSEDYVQADFQSGISLSIDEKKEDQYVISYDIAIGVKEIGDLVKAGKAAAQIQLNCRTTFYGNVFAVSSLRGRIPIPSDSVRGELAISCYVTAKESISRFKSGKVNPEFGSALIRFPQNAVLACDTPAHYWVDREVFRNITSIFDWSKDPELAEGQWRLNLDGERVEIVVSPTQLDILTQAGVTKRNQAIIRNSVIFGAILEIVNTLKGKNDYSERRWARNVLSKCASLGMVLTESSDAVEIAQKLMARPLVALNAMVFKSGDDR
jgi:hypothetical protein